MAKPSRLAAQQTDELKSLRILIEALCEKAGIDSAALLHKEMSEPLTREQMKGTALQEETAPKPRRKAKSEE